MSVLIRDPKLEDRIISERHTKGLDRCDEVWEGVYIMPPFPNNEHQFLQSRLNTIFDTVIGLSGLGEVLPGVNVSDRIENWTDNFRCPDIAVFLNGTSAQNCETFWFGGPDFAVEIVSPGDSSRDKLAFYASVGVRELLMIDRLPWKLELFRLEGGHLVLAGQSQSNLPNSLQSQVIPLSFRLIAGGARPAVEVMHNDGVQRWVV
jgi:Uma2 family endonuclease